MTENPWRVGQHYGIHVYEGDRPVATFHHPEDALRAVAQVNGEHLPLRRGADFPDWKRPGGPIRRWYECTCGDEIDYPVNEDGEAELLAHGVRPDKTPRAALLARGPVRPAKVFGRPAAEAGITVDTTTEEKS